MQGDLSVRWTAGIFGGGLREESKDAISHCGAEPCGLRALVGLVHRNTSAYANFAGMLRSVAEVDLPQGREPLPWTDGPGSSPC
jgi:hypothetical protein